MKDTNSSRIVHSLRGPFSQALSNARNLPGHNALDPHVVPQETAPVHSKQGCQRLAQACAAPQNMHGCAHAGACLRKHVLQARWVVRQILVWNLKMPIWHSLIVTDSGVKRAIWGDPAYLMAESLCS